MRSEQGDSPKSQKGLPDLTSVTPSNWAKIVKCSQNTALRDILGLVDYGILAKDAGGGRSTSYSLTQANEPQ